MALTTLLALLVGYTAWTNLRPVHLTASIDIEATPEEVWHVLTDLPAYGQWNPFITSAKVTSATGRLEEGAHLRIVLHDRTGDTTFTPVSSPRTRAVNCAGWARSAPAGSPTANTASPSRRQLPATSDSPRANASPVSPCPSPKALSTPTRSLSSMP
ncbi:SRPBCC family protein [Streptomyces sp. SBR177]